MSSVKEVGEVILYSPTKLDADIFPFSPVWDRGSVTMPSTLAVRNARIVGIRSPYVPLRYRYAMSAAYQAARVARRYGPGAIRAARAIQQAYRKRKRRPDRFRRQNIGEKPGSTSTKKYCPLDTDPAPNDTRTLYSTNITTLPRDNAAAGFAPAENISLRQRDIVNLRGWKINMEWVCNKSQTAFCCHVAVIAPKSGANSFSTDDFFRHDGDQRGIAFDRSVTNSLMFSSLMINPDKFTILKHKKFFLAEKGPAPNSSVVPTHQTNTRNSYYYVKMWVPLRRQLRFKDATENTPIDGNVFLVYWFDSPGITRGSPAVPSINISQRITTYFREPR